MKKVEPKPSSPERYQKLSMLMDPEDIPSKIHRVEDSPMDKLSEGSNKEIDYKISMLSIPTKKQESATNYDLSVSEANQDIEPKANNRYKVKNSETASMNDDADNQFNLPL